MKVYIIDNYDSFTYNLYQFIGEILAVRQHQGLINSYEIVVRRNDEVSLQSVKEAAPDRIIISPGPGSPEDSSYFGICAEVIAELGRSTPLLGVCLGMQGIVHAFGGRIIKAARPMHGKISAVTHNGRGLFSNIPDALEVMRYHSLMAESASLPDCLALTAVVGELPANAFENREKVRDGNNFEIMGVQHREFPVYGIQFHPESFATEGGRELLANFLFGCP